MVFIYYRFDLLLNLFTTTIMVYENFERSECKYSNCDCNKYPVSATATCDPLPPPASNPHQQLPVPANATCDPLPPPASNAHQQLPVPANATCDPLPPPASNVETRIRNHLQKLSDEMSVIREWESRDGLLPDRYITYSDYLAFKLTRSQIIDYMLVFKDCLCCKRHSNDVSAPSLPKTNGGIGEYCHEDACECNCRYILRKLNTALTISLS